jgi:hypothetical protein
VRPDSKTFVNQYKHCKSLSNVENKLILVKKITPDDDQHKKVEIGAEALSSDDFSFVIIIIFECNILTSG